MVVRVETALRLRKKLATSVMLSVFSLAWLVVLVPQVGAVGITTARGNNKLFGALVLGGSLDGNAESFKLTTMAAAEGGTAALTTPFSTGAFSGQAATASASVLTGTLVPTGHIKYIIKSALPTSTNPAADGGNGSITYSDASVLNLGSGFGALSALSGIASADGTSRYKFGGGPTIASTVCAAIGTVTDGQSLSPTESITFVFQMAVTDALAVGGAGFNFDAVPGSDPTCTSTPPGGGLIRADSVGQTQLGIPTTTTTTTTTTTSTTSTTHVVPTVGNWGMAVLGLAFLGAMAWMLGARRSHVRS